MSSSHAKDSSFLGGRIPPEIEIMSKNLKDVDQEMFRKILKGKYLILVKCLQVNLALIVSLKQLL